jgi:hypothetical protein
VLVVGEAFDAALAAATPVADDADVDPAETAWIFYTSGTTGRPKGAMLPHGVLNFVTVSWLADLTPLSERDVTLHAAPLSHGAGFHALAAVAPEQQSRWRCKRLTQGNIEWPIRTTKSSSASLTTMNSSSRCMTTSTMACARRSRRP